MRQQALLGAAFLLYCSCGGVEESPSEENQLLIPEQGDSLELPSQTFPLDQALQNQSLWGASDSSGAVLIGGTGGFYQLGDTELTQLGTQSVYSAIHISGQGFLFNMGDKLSIWNGNKLLDSPLNQFVKVSQDSEMAALGQLFVVAGEEALFIFDGGQQLLQFSELAASKSLSIDTAGQLIAGLSPQGPFLLRKQGDKYQLQMLADEISMSEVFSVFQGQAIGLSDTQMMRRIEQEGRVRWLAMALGKDASAPAIAQRIVPDTDSRALWIFTPSGVTRLVDQGRRASSVEVSMNLQNLNSAFGLNGALWLNDGLNLTRIGNPGPAVSFATTILAFHEKNCARCHVPGGLGRSLQNYSEWVENIDSAIEQLDQGTMPQDGAALLEGTVELLRRWRADGLRP